METGKVVKRQRAKVLKGNTRAMITGCGALHITVNEDDVGAFEVFTTMGKQGGCAASQCEAIGRMVTLGLRYSVPIKQIIKQLSGISCHSPVGFEDTKILSCADAIAKALKQYTDEKEIKK